MKLTNKNQSRSKSKRKDKQVRGGKIWGHYISLLKRKLLNLEQL